MLVINEEGNLYKRLRWGYDCSLIFILIFIWSLSASAQSIEKGQSICYEVQNYVNALVDFTKSTCVPSGGKEGALSFIIISSEPVLSVEAAKKAWLLVVVGSLGKTLNDQPSLKVDELWLSDTNHMKNRIAFVLQADIAKSLQKKAYNGQIELDEMYAKIQKNLEKKRIPKKELE